MSAQQFSTPVVTLPTFQSTELTMPPPPSSDTVTLASDSTVFGHSTAITSENEFTTQTGQLEQLPPPPQAVLAPSGQSSSPPVLGSQVPPGLPSVPSVPVCPNPTTVPSIPATAYGYPDADSGTSSNRYRTLTKNQWCSAPRGCFILMCINCLARFKLDRELCLSPEGYQSLNIKICHECVKRNRWARFDFKQYPTVQSIPPVEPASSVVHFPMDMA